MRHIFPPEDRPLDESWIRPLKSVARTIEGDFRYRFFDTHDFMLMGGLDRRPRPRIILYKHDHTRHYLNLDDAGHAYRYIPPRDISKGSGRYVAHRDLPSALDALGLWELPWMKPGLEAYREGVSWEDRWDLHPDLVEHGWYTGEQEDRNDHLRLVRDD